MRLKIIFLILIVFVSFEIFMAEKKTNPIFIFKNHELVVEKIEAGSWLNFLYTNRLGFFIRSVARTRFASKLNGIVQNSRWSKRKIKPFIKKYNINMNDFVVPPGGYASFNDFFIRKLKPGARSIDVDPLSLVAAADSKLLIIPNLQEQTQFFVKKKLFNLETFLQDSELAHAYKGGTLLLFRLAPYDYHHFHFPCDAIPGPVRKIAGGLESVNPIAYTPKLMPLETNERHLTILHSKLFGDVIFVSIGAMMVGKIIETYEPKKEYKKGDEMGFFAFGGSSLAVIFKPHTIECDDTVMAHSQKNIETVVVMGQRVARLIRKR